MRERISELEKRFPEDLAWKVTYDPTVFVADTIHEVQKTLLAAFVLVAIVVFLFLGNMRATIIPNTRGPISLIGTFVVLNAIGYSANTVSLLAVVLAIGIVVDDAIVVVENAERVMEEHPELSPAARREFSASWIHPAGRRALVSAKRHSASSSLTTSSVKGFGCEPIATGRLAWVFLATGDSHRLVDLAQHSAPRDAKRTLQAVAHSAMRSRTFFRRRCRAASTLTAPLLGAEVALRFFRHCTFWITLFGLRPAVPRLTAPIALR